MEKAVIVSSVQPLKAIIQDNQTGLIYNKGDNDDLAKTLIKLIEDENLREKIKKNGRQIIRDTKNWNQSIKKLIEFINYPKHTQ
jgi:glycosyltransferase involved in cell wall biosynthesis